MKINRHGRAKILTQQEIQLIFSHGLHNDRDKTLFGVCLFSAARIHEACTLLTEDIYTPKGFVRPQLIIRKANTKGKLATRSIPVIEDLRQLLTNYYPIAGKPYLFPGRSNEANKRKRGEASIGDPIGPQINQGALSLPSFSQAKCGEGHISHDSAARILRMACKEVGIIGVSTHSFRRTALTQMSNAGIPLRVIQEISGHRNLEQLQKYLEVSEEQVLGAAASLAMLSPVGQDVGKCMENDWHTCLRYN